MKLLESKIIRLVEERGYMGTKYIHVIKKIINFVENYIDEHPEYVKFFDHALVPDECFFQTVFMGSPYRNTRKEFLTYLEWEKNGNHPKVLKTDDMQMLLERPELFARKFDTKVDAKILDLLEALM